MTSNGTVKFFNNAKGFGFISLDSDGRDVFVHQSGLVDNNNEGDKVSFEVESSPKGLNAVNVRVI
ncbi:cold-shock protein [Ulvibacter antarcticus]|uniref:cold-shock protein n=1 Tax=Ulvibacter antarcticus TaxID=442714 RepID=UPI000EFA2D28|nr:cold shock domain-containing protein [Ulvibacter antarcticus]